MNFYGSLEDCWEIVVSTMANQIEQLQNEVHYKQKRIDQLELQNENMKIKLEKAEIPRINCPCEIKPMFDSSRDPFEEVGAGE